ncbi:MAG: proline--tRNA ligase, partial [Gammaproteobacteria bacterium]|nr:proline--tRNA ligase [Gammaproteobacteria bacterium]
MKVSQFPIFTLKDTPSEAEVASHKLMIKAGMIRKLSSGQYSWLPLGLRIIKKVEEIIRCELNKIGCSEILMPSVQPAELWKESERWDQYGPELLRFTDRHKRDFCLGP